MSEPTPASPAPPPPPSGPRVSPSGMRQRPYWGSLDVVLAVPVVFLVAALGALIAGSVAAAVDGWEFDSGVDMPVYALFIAVVFQQAAQAGWPWYVSRTKGNGVVEDWGLRFDLPRDLRLGVGIAVICLILVNVTTRLAEWAVSLPDDQDPSNTAIISDNEGSPWLIGIILLVVIGAPLTEELLFRGLIQRALEKSLGRYVAIGGSTILFAIPHIQAGATWQETAVLMAGIATIGFVLAIGADRYRRLGPVIIAHLLFNGFGTVATLAT